MCGTASLLVSKQLVEINDSTWQHNSSRHCYSTVCCNYMFISSISSAHVIFSSNGQILGSVAHDINLGVK